mmetsp:Transcript_3126/g.11276  ORF Transcript_3126/g.11276 Transcript_3126/m.11276 type:complete len:328 (-) Transcript_3126:181-1164(-)
MRALSQAGSCRDRTSELFAAAERLKGKVAVIDGKDGADSTAAMPLLPKQTGEAGKSEFSRKAARIGLGIHSTSTKLAKLAKLAKRTSMFDDPAAEIQELTGVVKQDITALNAAIEDLQRTRAEGTSNKQSTQHSATVVDNLKTRLLDTTKEFKDVLTIRTENLKVQKSRQQRFSSGALTNGSPLPSRPFDQHGGGTNTTPSKAQNLFGGSPGGAGSMGGEQTQQQSQQLMVHQQDRYLDSRAEALQNVESTINELSTIFTQLAQMVAEQGETAIRIDDNMDQTLINVDNAQNSLLKYMNRVQSNRWLIMKIFFVLALFLVIFVVFVA